MLRSICRVGVWLLATMVTANVAVAQDITVPASQRRPDLRVTFADTVIVASPSANALAPASLRRGATVGDRIGINIQAGLGFHSTRGLIDDSCGVIVPLFATEGFDAECGGSGGGKPFGFGAYLSYAHPMGSTRLQLQGGYSFTAESEIRLETSASLDDDADIMITGGYRFTGQTFYGGAGVEVGRMYVGGIFGLYRFSGDEFLSQRVEFDGQVFDESADERPKSGSSALFGFRWMMNLARDRGVRLYADVKFSGLGDYYETYTDAELIPGLRRPVRLTEAQFGVAFDVYSFFK